MRGRSGSVLLTTSPRTAAQSAQALCDELRAPAVVHRWPSATANPYRGLLACGDEFIVTADSMSMLAEACATGRPVYLFDYPAATSGRSALRWKPLVHRLAMSLGPVRMRRDVRRIHAALLDAGRIRRLEAQDHSLPRTVSSVQADDLARTVARVQALLANR